MNHQKNAAQVQTYFSLILTSSLVVMIPVFFFVSRYHREIVEIVFAGKFVEYSQLLTIVFFFAAANAIDVPVTLVAQLKEKAHIILASRIFSVYNVVALLVLIPRMGILGAMLASGSAMLMKNLFIWWFVRDLAVWSDVWRFLSRAATVWIPFVAISVLADMLLPDQPLLKLAFGVLLWSALFTMYLRYWALTFEQKQLMATLFPGKETKVLRAFGFVH